MRTVKYLMGDGHLGRLDARLLGPGWANLAKDGATAREVLTSLLEIPLLTADDVVVLSVGTNDADSTPQVQLRTFLAEVEQILRGLFPARVACLLPPGVDESRIGGAHHHTNIVVLQWAAAAARLAVEDDAMVLDLRASLAPLGDDAFAEDGLHLSPAGEAVLVELLHACAEEAVHQRAADIPLQRERAEQNA